MGFILGNIFLENIHNRRCMFETNDLDEAIEIGRKILNPHQLVVMGNNADGSRARMDCLALDSMLLLQLRYRVPLIVKPDPLFEFYLLTVPLRGEACFFVNGKTFFANRYKGIILSPSQDFHFKASEDYDQIMIRVDRNAVEMGWGAIVGTPFDGEIEFDPIIEIGGATWRSIEPIFDFIARSARMENKELHLRLLDKRLEEMLIMNLLLQQPHSQASFLLSKACGPHSPHLRRAIGYMEEHIGDQLSLTQISNACGVSARTLQLAFNTAYGCGPVQWLRQQRLSRIRESLLRGENFHSIADLVHGFGFSHFGDFSKSYKQMFGETARETLIRRG
ncbi:AraC family transcriptional regulator [Burkholderia cepacia]|uniref:AraC family transcriptional regulator n=1 Tax=Burkholderia cepacia TaxID=292 RepID=UPI0009C0582F|nr:AraC family transcriptional regulator [Burkholderia cepacia]